MKAATNAQDGPSNAPYSGSTGEGPTTKRKRSLFKIGPVFLRHYFLIWVVMTIAFVLATGAILFFSNRNLVGGSSDSQYAKLLSLILRTNAIFILLVTLFMGTYTLLLSHRMAGPAYRVNNTIRRILEGDYGTRIELRANDFLHDVADNMNLLLEHLDHREKKRREREKQSLDARQSHLEIEERATRLVRDILDEPGVPERVRAAAKEVEVALRGRREGRRDS